MSNLLDAASNNDWSPNKRNLLLAWFVHIFTASGVIWGFLAILAIISEDWVLAFLWMFAAVFVDSFDGILARRARVKEAVPGFDGALLDNMIDYLNYVVVPAIFIYSFGFLPERFALFAVSLIMMASAYQFCQIEAKTEDHYFTGFPSYWNVLVFYLFILNLEPAINLAIILILAVLIFVPIKYIYPTRTERYQRLTMPLALIWGVAGIAILLQYPEPDPRLILYVILFAVYYIGVSLYSMFTNKS